MSGLTLKLIRTSVGEMLETLSDDDYVNVVYVSIYTFIQSYRERERQKEREREMGLIEK